MVLDHTRPCNALLSVCPVSLGWWPPGSAVANGRSHSSSGLHGLPLCVCVHLLYSPAVRGQWLFPNLGCCEQDGSAHWSKRCSGDFLWGDVWKDLIMSLETFVLFSICLFIQDLHQSTCPPTLHSHSLYSILSKITIWVSIVLFWYNIKISLPGPGPMFFSVLP